MEKHSINYNEEVREVIVWKLVALVLFCICFAFLWNSRKAETYYSSRYGHTCWEKGNEPDGVKYPIEFNSLDECKSFISNPK